MEEHLHHLRLPHALHVLGPSCDYGLVRAHCGKAVGHARLAEQALEERVFEVRADLHLAFGQAAHVGIVPARHVLLDAGDGEYRAVRLAEAATVAF